MDVLGLLAGTGPWLSPAAEWGRERVRLGVDVIDVLPVGPLQLGCVPSLFTQLHLHLATAPSFTLFFSRSIPFASMLFSLTSLLGPPSIFVLLFFLSSLIFLVASKNYLETLSY